MKSIPLIEITNTLDQLLHTTPMRDVSVNGLQFPGCDMVRKVAVATDASEDTIAASIANDCDLLFVHHGLFWTYAKESAITLARKRKLKLMIDADLSLYASHLPLDVHPEVGNNISLARRLGLLPQGNVFLDKEPMGVLSTPPSPLEFAQLLDLVKDRLGGDCKGYRFHDKPIQRICIVTGQGQAAISQCLAQGFDTLITGEMNHYSYHSAKEVSLNIILAGHYQSETLGVQAVGAYLQSRLDVPYIFLDFPTGL